MSRKKTLKGIALICLSSFFTHFTVMSQGSVSGTVMDDHGQSVVSASVVLLKPKDSSLVKGVFTDKSGKYDLSDIKSGEYFVSVSYTNYKTFYTNPFIIDGGRHVQLDTIKLETDEVTLNNVTVTGRKPLFEQKIDRMVINVANSITNTGSTALEVLIRSPGVIVNQQSNNISIFGKEGVFVMLNGRINRMPMEALFQFLAGMNASNIEKIELITTPPANFDAEGNAGFINIVMKKSMQDGTNGSFSLTGGYGIGGGPVVGSSINLNYRKDKLNIYGDYSFSWLEPAITGKIYRQVNNSNKVTEIFAKTDRDDFRRSHNARLGLDYKAGKKTTIGFLLSGFSNLYSMVAINTSEIYVNGKLDTSMIINQDEKHPLNNYSINLNAVHEFKEDQQVQFNLNYNNFKDANTLNYLTNMYDKGGNFLASDQTKSSKETPLHIWVGSMDYNRKLGNIIALETGLKATFSDFINDVVVEQFKNPDWVVLDEYTSKHDLNESIFAGYVSGNVRFNEKTNGKFGLRYEYTNSVLNSANQKKIVDRHYSNLFPSLFISHAFRDNQSMNFSYTKRITRPTFNDMAPFVYFVDPNTFFSGNPALQPSISDAIKIDYLFNRFIFSLSYTYEKSPITNFSPVIDSITNKLILFAQNQDNQQTASASLIFPYKLNKWWNMQNSVTGQWLELNGSYLESPINIRQISFLLNTTQTFTLPRDFSIELFVNYNYGGMFGIYKLDPMLTMDLALQKKLGPNGGVLTFNVNQFTGPPHVVFTLYEPELNLNTNGDFRFTVTTFKLTYSRKFGNQKVKESRTRTTGAEEEKQRVNVN